MVKKQPLFIYFQGLSDIFQAIIIAKVRDNVIYFGY